MTLKSPLEFEKPLVDLELKLDELKQQVAGGKQELIKDCTKLEEQVAKLVKDTYGNLSAYQRVQLSRHFDRPFTLDFIKHIATDFIEFHGDRCFGDDEAIVGGTANIAGIKVMIIGHQRGRTTEERLRRNFGMSNPEGYRKALRLFRMAEKFKLPIINLIDTQGAYPGLEAEERGQAEAIARNIQDLSEITVPIICVVIGEGGSGGALALGVGDKILMLENSCYSVITPEGCAAILWGQDASGNASYAAMAADALNLTAEKQLKNKIVDEVVKEPFGGAHRNHKEAAELLQLSLVKHLEDLSKFTVEEMLAARYKKFREFGPVLEN